MASAEIHMPVENLSKLLNKKAGVWITPFKRWSVWLILPLEVTPEFRRSD